MNKKLKKLALLFCFLFSFSLVQQAHATIIVVCNNGEVSGVYYDDDGCGFDVETYGC